MLEEAKVDSTGAGDGPARLELHWETGVKTMHDAQRAFMAEAVLGTTEMLDRLRTESHLWNELISKMASVHSVKDLGAAWEECGRHQIDFARREAERFFDHGMHLLDASAGLLKSTKPPEKDAA